MIRMDIEAYAEVGKVSYEAMMYARGLVKPGAKLVDVADATEAFINGKGFEMAFPTNLSVGHEAAHYTPSFNDTKVFGANDIVKVDVGARKGDMLGDCAITVDLSDQYGKLVEASEKALEAAIGMVKAGRKLNEIGAEVEKIASASGFNPIKNLGGHGIVAGELHANIFIPNYDNGDETELEEGEVIAIETFITTGKGSVKDGENVQIFQKVADATPRLNISRDVLSYISKNYSTYPFATRWLISKYNSEFMVKTALNELYSISALESFPVLVEESEGIVAQTEKTMIVDKDSCRILTE